MVKSQKQLKNVLYLLLQALFMGNKAKICAPLPFTFALFTYKERICSELFNSGHVRMQNFLMKNCPLLL